MDFSLLPIKQMRLQDGSVSAGASDADVGSNRIFFLKLCSLFVHARQHRHTSWFDYSIAEAIVDRILAFMRHEAGRPPMRFYVDAWVATAPVFQRAVRSCKSSTEPSEAGGIYKHLVGH